MTGFTRYLGLAAALNSLAWRPRRAASDELPDEEDDRDSLSDSLDDDDESVVKQLFDYVSAQWV